MTCMFFARINNQVVNNQTFLVNVFAGNEIFVLVQHVLISNPFVKEFYDKNGETLAKQKGRTSILTQFVNIS